MKKSPPSLRQRGCELLGEVGVIEDVLLAVAVVTGALGAVTELEIGIVGICLSADGAFVVIAALLLLFMHGLAELDRLRTMSGFFKVNTAAKLRREEYKQICKSNDRHHCKTEIAGKEIRNHRDRIQCAFKPCDPFHFERDHKENINCGFSVENRVGKEHCGIDILGTGNLNGQSIDQIDKDCGHSGKKNAAEVVNCEFCSSPDAFQRGSQPVVEHTRDQQPDAAAAGEEKVGENAPDLAAKDGGRFQCEKVQRSSAGKHLKKIERNIGNNHITHQTGDAQTGVSGTETVDRIA